MVASKGWGGGQSWFSGETVSPLFFLLIWEDEKFLEPEGY